MNIASLYTPFSIVDQDKVTLFVHHWDCEDPVAIVIIAHGMMEHAKRYARFAEVLNENKFTVFAPDHRGHGRTADETGLGILGETATWHDWVRNLDDVVVRAKEKYPDLPVFFLGHSMGSFLGQMYAAEYPNQLQGLLLSGTTEESRLTSWFGKVLTSFLIAINGKNASGKLVGWIVFFGFCHKIPTRKTIFDWLTRDDNEVTAYLNDPLCGQIPSLFFFHELFALLYTVYQTSTLKKIPKSLPIYVYSGTNDPLSSYGKRVKQLANRYRELGHQVSESYYENGRHEMHNELNRDEVFRNIIRWIKLHLS